MKQIKIFLGIIAWALIIVIGGSNLYNAQYVDAQNTACFKPQGGAMVVAATACEYEFRSGSTLDIQSGATFTVDDISLSASQSGSQANAITGTLIAHGLATTPTSVLLTAGSSSVFTNTPYVLATNATSFTVGLGYTTGAITVPTLYWFAGK